MPESPLEKLIGLDQHASSDERREVLRAVTDAFIVASDRYGHRHMQLFDLLLSRTANQMDQRLRRMIVLTLIRAGARDDHVRHVLSGIPSPNGRFLRRTVTQPVRDILSFFIENTTDTELSQDLPLDDGNSVKLPTAILEWMFAYQLGYYRDTLSPKCGEDRVNLMARTANRFRAEIINSASEAGRDEVVVARRTVADWARTHSVTEAVLIELLEARAMTEFLLAAAQMFDMDVATVIRVMNDVTFHSCAIVMKAHHIRRASFAKIIGGFRHRKTDGELAEKVLPLYDKLTAEAAERSVRFWRVRVSDLDASSEKTALAAAG